MGNVLQVDSFASDLYILKPAEKFHGIANFHYALAPLESSALKFRGGNVMREMSKTVPFRTFSVYGDY